MSRVSSGSCSMGAWSLVLIGWMDAVWEAMESDWLTPHSVVPAGVLRWRP